MRFFNIPMINLFGFLTSTYCASPTPKIVVRIVDNKLLAKQANRGIKSFLTLILDKYAALIKGEMCVSRTTNYVLFISRLRVLPSQILMLNLGLFVKISFLGNVSISTHLELRGLQVTSMLIYQWPSLHEQLAILCSSWSLKHSLHDVRFSSYRWVPIWQECFINDLL